MNNKFPIIEMPDPWNEFPAQPGSISWDLIAPHDAQAMRNHGGQNLETLARRGGLSPCEAVAILEDIDYLKRWPNKLFSHKEVVAHHTEAINRLRELLAVVAGQTSQ